MPESEPILVDARGHRCPTPTLRLRRALEAAREGDNVLLLVDDPMAAIDVPHFAAEAGHDLLDQVREDGVLRFTLRKRSSGAGGDRA